MVNLKHIFPALTKGNYRITSPKDANYNCIAWAVGDTGRWWWPGPDITDQYWPKEVEREATPAAFEAVFASLGFVRCDQEEPESGFEKIALFVNAHGKPTHVARQMPNGRWSSKLGSMQDIEHALHDLEGTVYGSVVQMLKRPTTAERREEL